MTPKEKAFKISQKFQNQVGMFSKESKKRALILCDEFIEWFLQNTGMYDQISFEADKNYWQEVKQEIEKL